MFAVGRRIIRVSKESGIPLLGYIAFGVIDRGTNLLQVRACTLCPYECIFCSVDAGPKSRTRQVEFIVDVDYLIETFERVVEEKGIDDVEAHLDGMGEPTAHPEIVEIVRRIREVPGVKVISMQSRGFRLDKKLVKELERAGLDRINLSIDAIDEGVARFLNPSPLYNHRKLLEMAEYIAKETSIDLHITPVWIPGINDGEIRKIVEFALKIGAGKRWPPLGIQKLLFHKRGRKVKGSRDVSWGEFYRFLEELEREYGIKLRLSLADYGMHPAPTVRYPHKAGEKVRVKIVSPGIFKGEVVGRTPRGWAVAIVGVKGCEKLLGREAIVRIIEDKHGLYIAKLEL